MVGGHAGLGRHDWWEFVTQGSGWTVVLMLMCFDGENG